MTRRNFASLMLICVATSMLAGCTLSPTPMGGADVVFCKADKLITWSQKDTDETIGQVKAHNSVHRALC